MRERAAQAPLWVRLDDGRVLPLSLESLWEEPGRGLRCSVPSRRSGRGLAARFTNTAQMDMARWLTWPEELMSDESEAIEEGDGEDEAPVDARPRLDLSPLGGPCVTDSGTSNTAAIASASARMDTRRPVQTLKTGAFRLA